MQKVLDSLPEYLDDDNPKNTTTRWYVIRKPSLVTKNAQQYWEVPLERRVLRRKKVSTAQSVEETAKKAATEARKMGRR